MLELAIKSTTGQWQVTRQFRVTDIIEMTPKAVVLNRVDGRTETHDLRGADWHIRTCQD